MDLQDVVSKYPPRQLLMLPLAIVVLALIILGANYLSTGSPVKLGVEFTGGTIVTVPAIESEQALTQKLAEYPVLEVRNIGERYLIQFGPMGQLDQEKLQNQINSQYQNAEIKYMGPIYSQNLQYQALRFIPISFALMAIVVFFVFWIQKYFSKDARSAPQSTPIVSLMVVGCALTDIAIAAASMNLTGVKLSLGTVAALLMLIGYSVDTDILLTSTVLTPRQKFSVDETIVSTMKTGLMMTGTTISAVLALFLASNFLYLIIPSFTRMDIIADISTVLLFGLAADIFNTWITNAQAIRWYMSRPKKAIGRQKR